MDIQSILELLQQLGISGINAGELEKKEKKLLRPDISGEKSGQAGEILECMGSESSIDQDEMTELIQELTSGITGEKRQELQEYILQAAKQLEDEQLSAELLKMIEFFLKQD